MSTLPPKADIAERDRDVRFVPKADIRKAIALEFGSRRPHVPLRSQREQDTQTLCSVAVEWQW
jgi:hypothetical protein